jgi:SCY1-like protein 1
LPEPHGCATSQVDTISFLEKLSLKDGSEKDQFFRRLNVTLDALPAAVVQRKILPLIASGLEFGSAPGAAVSSLLHAARGFTPAQLSSRVIPCVIRLYASTDRATRVALLQHLDVYVSHISAAQMEALYEQLANGFNDGTAFLRELTLKSLLQVVPQLSQRTLTSSLLKHLAKLQVDEEPAIRANTTICLGNISRYLGAAACKRVLLNAFTRALRDPFPPARAAGLMALQATLEHYDASEGALRVLPCIAPLTVDADRGVRVAAFEAMDAFVELLRKHHHARDAEAPGSDGAAAAARPLLSPGDVPATAAAGGASGGGFLGWAVAAAAAAVGAPSVTPEKAKPSPARKSTGTAAASAVAAAAATAAAAASPSGSAAHRQPTASEGWGGGGDDEFGVDDVRRVLWPRLPRIDAVRAA